MIDINELRRLVQAATPGPWFSDARGNIWRRSPSDLYENGGSVAGDKPIAFVVAGWVGEGITGYPAEDNANLIAAANPATISELLDRLEATERERDALRAKVEAMEQQEPAAFALYSGWARKAVYLSELEACDQRDRRQLTADLGGSLEAYRVIPLYDLPGAKGE